MQDQQEGPGPIPELEMEPEEFSLEDVAKLRASRLGGKVLRLLDRGLAQSRHDVIEAVGPNRGNENALYEKGQLDAGLAIRAMLFGDEP